MNSKHAGILGTISLVFLSGCASMSSDECLTSDWHAIGYEDGSRGQAADALGGRRKACAKHGVTPNFDAYQSGRAEGLHEFCRPSRAFNLGTSGGRYNGVCPSSTEGTFLDAYNSGHQLYTLRSAVTAADSRINARKRELKNLEEEITQSEAALIARETTVEQRVLLLADLKDMSERTGTVEAEIYALIEERTTAEQELQSYQLVLVDSGLSF